MLDDRVNAAALFRASKMKRKLERCAHQRDAEDADECSGRGECPGRQREPGAFLSEQIMARCRDVLETELWDEMRPMADRVDGAFEYKARYRPFYRNDGDCGVGR